MGEGRKNEKQCQHCQDKNHAHSLFRDPPENPVSSTRSPKERHRSTLNSLAFGQDQTVCKLGQWKSHQAEEGEGGCQQGPTELEEAQSLQGREQDTERDK